MNIEYKIVTLTEKFYLDYPSDNYPEILEKSKRAYNCLMLELNDYYICIPYRSEMRHNHGYKFTKSKRSIKSQSGLDYTKIVIVKNIEYLSKLNAVIDADEFKETVENIGKIARGANRFITDYIKIVRNNVDDKGLPKRFRFSTLQYFHKELSIL